MDERIRITVKEASKNEVGREPRQRKWLSHSGHSLEGRQDYRPHFRVEQGPSR